MKVHELIAELSKLPQDFEVFVSSDAEGNSYNELTDVSVSPYVFDDPYYEYHLIHPDDLGEYDDDVIGYAVYLYP